MKVTKTNIKSLSKEIGYSVTFLQHVYDQMTIGNPKADEIGLAELKTQMQWVSEQNIVTTEMYDVKIESMIEYMKKTQEKSKDDADALEMNELRKKLGYTNKEWRQAKIVENHLRKQLKNLIEEFMGQAVTKEINLKETPEKIRETIAFQRIDRRWREFARNYAIREYPKANTHKEIRTRLTGLFDKKLFEALGVAKANEATRTLDDIDAKDDERGDDQNRENDELNLGFPSV